MHHFGLETVNDILTRQVQRVWRKIVQKVHNAGVYCFCAQLGSTALSPGLLLRWLFWRSFPVILHLSGSEMHSREGYSLVSTIALLDYWLINRGLLLLLLRKCVRRRHCCRLRSTGSRRSDIRRREPTFLPAATSPPPCALLIRSSHDSRSDRKG